jgi:RimJ/RimL family protein N-acetyltransferase
MPTPADALDSARLRFRRPVASDANAIFERYSSDPDVTRYLGWARHRSLDDTRGFLAFSDSEWTKSPAGPLLIESKEDGRLLGSTGLMFDGPSSAMVGYVFARDAWGRGYATEALGVMVSLADSLGVTHLHSACHPMHRASAHVLEKGGFHLNARFTAERFPNLENDRGDALRFLRPPMLKIEHLQGQHDVDACALIMATSEPWITLGRTAEALRPVISDPVKEVHLVRDAHGVAAFVILDMRGPLGGYVQTIAVRADRRSSGLGAAILSAVEERVFQQSKNVFLCVSSFNDRAQRFYARMGYERIGVWREYVVPGSDEILMRKTIGPLRP